jgi:hypothetical protein
MAPDAQSWIDLVTRYLDACAAGRLEEAESYLADVRELVFPWGRFRTPTEVVLAGQQRYRCARKRYDTWDVTFGGDQSTVVIVTGTLHGEAFDGTPFSDIRFIDRFVIRDGRIVLHQVWNDLAESGIPARDRSRSHVGRGG